VRFTTAADLVMTLETAQRQGRWKEAMHRAISKVAPENKFARDSLLEEAGFEPRLS
jgi:hypothetical protein